jgi:hypothetical protein
MAKSDNIEYLSFKKNERDQRLKEYVATKGCKSAWIKEAMEEKMEKEIQLIFPVQNNTNNNYIPYNNIPTFNEDIM